MDITEKYISRGKDIKSRELDSQCVLLNLETGSYYTLNRVGAFIWDLLDGKTMAHEIIGRVVDRFRVKEETAADDVKALLRELEGEGLIEMTEIPAHQR
jgi:hypothetical protein